jgi:hypothetical protein
MSVNRVVSGQLLLQEYVMVQGQATREEESASIAKSGTNGSASIEGIELADELGPIPSFPPLALDPKTGRMLPISDDQRIGTTWPSFSVATL